MPNHVTNVLKLKGHKDEILGCLSAIMRDPEDGEERSNYSGIGTIDFEKIIPMPKNIYRGNLGPDERKNMETTTGQLLIGALSGMLTTRIITT